MYRAIFEEDEVVPKNNDGLTTRPEALEARTYSDKLGLGGGVITIVVDKTGKAAKDDRKPHILKYANGTEINAGVLLAALKNATPAQLVELQKQYSKMSADGPRGIAWHCTETEYYAARNAAAAVGIVVLGGGTISDGVVDIEAIGSEAFGLPPQGNVEGNFVIRCQGLPGKQAADCNAAFLQHMLDAGGVVAGNAFVAARSTDPGWRASTDTPRGGAVDLKEK